MMIRQNEMSTEAGQLQAQVTALFYIDDLSVAEIAQLLDCAEGTVKAHLHAARRRLRDLLSDLGKAPT